MHYWSVLILFLSTKTVKIPFFFLLLSACDYIPTGRNHALNSEVVANNEMRLTKNSGRYTSVHAQYTETTPPLSRDSAWSIVRLAASISLAFARSFENQAFGRRR